MPGNVTPTGETAQAGAGDDGVHEANGERAMKAFVSAVAVAVLLAVGAAFALDWLDMSTANVEHSQGNVRL